MKQYIFFGGTFDPVHKGHLAVAGRAAGIFGADGSVLLAPAFVPPHKDAGKILSFEHRLNMVQCAVSGKENLQVCTIEREREGKSYSFDTLHILHTLHPEDQINLLIGGDSPLQLHSWYRAKDLVRDFRIIVYPRPGEEPDKAMLRRYWTEEETEKLLSFVLKDVPLFPVSSTSIREMYRSGRREEAEKYVPEKVASYIRKNLLYFS